MIRLYGKLFCYFACCKVCSSNGQNSCPQLLLYQFDNLLISRLNKSVEKIKVKTRNKSSVKKASLIPCFYTVSELVCFLFLQLNVKQDTFDE